MCRCDGWWRCILHHYYSYYAKRRDRANKIYQMGAGLNNFQCLTFMLTVKISGDEFAWLTNVWCWQCLTIHPTNTLSPVADIYSPFVMTFGCRMYARNYYWHHTHTYVCACLASHNGIVFWLLSTVSISISIWIGIILKVTPSSYLLSKLLPVFLVTPIVHLLFQVIPVLLVIFLLSNPCFIIVA